MICDALRGLFAVNWCKPKPVSSDVCSALLCSTNFLGKQAEGYDPTKSKISQDKMEAWRNSTVSGNLDEVPGIGPAAMKALRSGSDTDDHITNTYQLFGKYLMLRGPDTPDDPVDVDTTNQKFWYWLKLKGVSAYRSAIVLAVYEKTSTFFPGWWHGSAEDAADSDEE